MTEEFVTRRPPESKPTLFDLSKRDECERVRELRENGTILTINNEYVSQLREYFQVQNPPLVYSDKFESEFKKYREGLEKKTLIWQQGKWVYYPWLYSLVHILDEEPFFEVRTARNKNLITKEEQDIFYNSTVGIAGLSVGNSVALAIVLEGGARRIKLADHDILELSNINRIRTGVENLGVNKAEASAREIYQINPYAEVDLFPKGLNKGNINTFFSSLKVVVDEIDNLAIKYLIREKARENGLPVVMAADNGDNGVVDIERYDLKKDTPFFHNRMGEISFEDLEKLDKFGIGRMISKHIGPENISVRLNQSFMEIGKSLVSWPQLGGAALLNGSAVAYCVRRILNGQPLEDNRSLISLDEKLDSSYSSSKSRISRKKAAEQFNKIFGL